MTNCSCGTCECQDTITKLERQQLENIRTITNLEMKIEKLQTKKHMFPENFPQEEEECIACSA
tara:strand:+ start:393 stop:581 length:189 start_codon:yes stop_codon:yes gene_type:complete